MGRRRRTDQFSKYVLDFIFNGALWARSRNFILFALFSVTVLPSFIVMLAAAETPAHWSRTALVVVFIIGTSLTIAWFVMTVVENLRRFRIINEQAQEPKFLVNEAGHIVYVNQAAIHNLGYCEADLLELNIAAIDARYDRNVFGKLFKSDHAPYVETVLKRRDGTCYPVELGITVISFYGRKYLFISARDMTERKKAQKTAEELVLQRLMTQWEKNKNAQLQEEIGLRKKVEGELRAKELELQKALDIKKEFTSTVSHELRTPLAISKEAMSLLLRGKVGDMTPKQKEIIQIAGSNLDRLNMLINDILDFSKIEAGKMQIIKEKVDVMPLLQEIHQGWQLQAEQKGVRLTLNIPPGRLILTLDQVRFMQICSNLINNAIKFTPEGGQVDITVEDGEAECRFSVRDTGPGIAAHDTGHIFQKFRQIQRKDGPGIHGTGLGLSIAKSLVEMHGGHISFESEVGQGTVFTFTIPKEVSAYAPKDSHHR